MEVFTLPIQKTSTCTTLPPPSPDLATFCRLDELGPIAIGQYPDMTARSLECRLAEPDPWCHHCGTEGVSRGTIARRLSHEPFGHRPTTLLVRVRRYRWPGCGRAWREDLSPAAPSRAKLSRRGARWALEAVVVDHLSISRVAAGLGVSWHTANDAVIDARRELLIDDETRLDGVTTIGVDEHV